MTRELYPGVLVQQPNGDPAPTTPFTIWNDLSGGVDVTGSLTAADGVGNYTPVTDDGGQLLPFRGPDGYQGFLFADTGTGMRYSLVPVSVWPQLLTVLGYGSAVVLWGAIPDKPTTFPPSTHTHQSGQIDDSTTVGRALMTAADAQVARAAIGAGTGNGTSNLTLGTTSTTAAPGNHAHTATQVAFTPSGAITATNAQDAIVQAAASGGTSTAATGVYPWKYQSGGYPTLPSTQLAGVQVITAFGPVQPATVPSWVGYGAGQALLEYTYAPLT